MSPEIISLDRWPFWAGGIAIGAFVLVFLLMTNRLLGVSSGFRDACAAWTDPTVRRSWRLPFLGGIVAGGLLAALMTGTAVPTTAMGMFDTVVSGSIWTKAVVFMVGGVLIGFGTGLAGGCTSGHGIVGTALRSPASLLATGTFMASGFVVTNLLLRGLGA